MWTTVPIPLQTYAGNIKSDILESICPPLEHIKTMDGVSKCWECIPPNSSELLVGPTNGIVLSYCKENSGYIHNHILVCLFCVCFCMAICLTMCVTNRK
jgi:hypothetical protein